jgi:hypothetical protein
VSSDASNRSEPDMYSPALGWPDEPIGLNSPNQQASTDRGGRSVISTRSSHDPIPAASRSKSSAARLAHTACGAHPSQ